MPVNIEATLSGGNPRTLGRTQDVVEHVLSHPERLDDLFACVTSADETVRMRAGDALEKVCRVHPDWLDPYVNRLLGEVATIDQPTLDVFAHFARADDTLRDYFAGQLQRHLSNPHKSVAKRVGKLLADPTIKV